METSIRFKADGGALDSESPLYVARKADDELYNHLRRGDYCYVTNARQMGKSSLMIRTERRLADEGVACVIIDLQRREKNSSEDDWYNDFIDEVAMQLPSVDYDVHQEWRQGDRTAPTSPTKRLKSFLEHVIQERITSPLVIFIDEIDMLRGLGFDTDNFLRLVRSFHQRQAHDRQFRRLTFCFLGLASPYQLIRDRSQAPFNIGYSIELEGLSLPHANVLLAGLEGKVIDPESTLNSVLTWTGGQPFLTQKLLKEVSEHGDTIPDAAKAVEEIAITRVIHNWQSNDNPPHLRPMLERLIGSGKNKRAGVQRKRDVLQLMRRIYDQEGLPEDSEDEAQRELRLTGLVISRSGRLQIFNPIYEQIFSREWVEHIQQELPPVLYAEQFRLWSEAEAAEKSKHLLNTGALEEAELWAKDRDDLLEEEIQFLAACRAAEAEAKLTRQKAKELRILKNGLICLAITLVGFGAWYRFKPLYHAASIPDLESYCRHTGPHEEYIRKLTSCGEDQLFEGQGEPAHQAHHLFASGRYKEARNAFAQIRDRPQAEIAGNNAAILADPQNKSPIYVIATSLPGNDTRPDVHLGLLSGLAKAQTSFNRLAREIDTTGKKPRLFIILADDSNESADARALAKHFGRQHFIQAMIGTYSSEITYAQLQGLSGFQMPIVTASSTATKEAFLARNKRDKGAATRMNLDLFFRSVNTTKTEARSLASYLNQLKPKNNRILFFYQNDPTRPDLYADSYAQEFRLEADRIGMDFFVPSPRSGAGSKAGINLHHFGDLTAERDIQQILSDFKQSQTTGQGRNIVAILVSASRSKDQRKKVDTIFTFAEKDGDGDFVIAGANTLFGDDYASRLCCNRFVAAVTSRPVERSQTSMKMRMAGASFDAAGLLLQAMTDLSKQGKEVNRASLAATMKSGRIKIQSQSPVAANFEMRESERFPRRGWIVTPSGIAKKWITLQEYRW
jgi:hypothetical protein